MKAGFCGLSLMLAILAASCSQGTAQTTAPISELKTAAIFSDNMVLQQGQPIRVWGWASDGAKVTVDLNGQKASAMAADGKWLVSLKPMPLGGPFTMTITAGDKKIEYKNVLVGDIWVCSGQSNMELPVAVCNNAQAEIAAANLPEIRLFTVEKATSRTPVADVKGTWVVCSPETVGGFSAVGYYFGRELNKAGIKNIGLINTSWGGTPAEAWTTLDTLKSDADYAPILQRDTNPDDIRAQAGGQVWKTGHGRDRPRQAVQRFPHGQRGLGGRRCGCRQVGNDGPAEELGAGRFGHRRYCLVPQAD